MFFKKIQHLQTVFTFKVTIFALLCSLYFLNSKMPNPYNTFFDESYEEKKPESTPKLPVVQEFVANPGPEPLDAILEKINNFKEKAAIFSAFLSKTNAINHKEEAEASNDFMAFIFISEPRQPFGVLNQEKEHYALLQDKFQGIVTQMKTLAITHYEIIQQFNRDIDKNYYSIEKNDAIVKNDIETAVENLNLQRKILSNAARDLEILENALHTAEKRMQKYIDIGGTHNLSSAEWAVLKQQRKLMTDGSTHQFNYTFFRMNLVDKLAIRFGVFLKETTSQYLQQLTGAFEMRKE
jgi:hypothetical protein